MDNGVMDERNNLKALLVPGAVPLPIHNLVNINDSSDSDDNLPSTIDFDALKVPGLPETSFQNVMSWRGGTPRIKIKQPSIPNESPRKETKPLFAYETVASVSDVSQTHESPSVSEDSESDSDSSSEESDSSSGSSGSSASSESDSGSRSSGTDTSDKKLKTTPVSAKSSCSFNRGKDSQSVSNSSSSSRHKKRFTTTNYQPGSLKLRLSVFDQHGAKSSTTETTPQRQPLLNSESKLQPPASTKLPIVPQQSSSTSFVSSAGSKWKTARLATNGEIETTQVQLPFSSDPIPLLSPALASKRITRQSLTSETATVVPQNSLLLLTKGKNAEGLNLHNDFLTVGQTSQLTDSVTMTRVAAPRHSTPCVVSPSKVQTSGGQGHRPHLSDPVKYLVEKKSDLTISPIMSPPLSNKTVWNNNNGSPPKVPFTLPIPNGHTTTSPKDVIWQNCNGAAKDKYRRNGEYKLDFVEVKLRLPPKLDLSVHSITKEKTDKIQIVDNGGESKVEEVVVKANKKIGKCNGKSEPLRNRSKLSVFLPGVLKSKPSLHSQLIPEETRSRVKVRRPLPKPVGGCYTNSDGNNIKDAQIYHSVKLAATIVEKKKALLNGHSTPVKKLPVSDGILVNGELNVKPKLTFRTKGAKKYIPEPIEIPVIESSRTNGKSTRSEERLVKSSSPKKKVKRSRSEERMVNGEKSRKKRKANSANVDNLLELNELFREMTIGRRPAARKCLSTKSTSRSPNSSSTFSDYPGFTFEQKVFKNFVPPFPVTSVLTSPTRRESLPTKTQGSRGLSPGITSGRRKRGSMLSKSRSNSNLDSYENGSPDLQKLPLKKRHGHGNQHYDGHLEESGEESVFVFGSSSRISSYVHSTSPLAHLYFQTKSKAVKTFCDFVAPNRKLKTSKRSVFEGTSFSLTPPSSVKVPVTPVEKLVPAVKRGRPRKSDSVQEKVPVQPPVAITTVMPLIEPNAECRRSMRPRKQPLDEIKVTDEEGEVTRSRNSRSKSKSKSDTCEDSGLLLPPLPISAVVGPKITEHQSKSLPGGSPHPNPPVRPRGRPRKTLPEVYQPLEIEPPPAVLIVRDKNSRALNLNEELLDDTVVIDSDCPLEFVDLPDFNGNMPFHVPLLAPPDMLMSLPLRLPLKLIPTPSTSPGATGSGKKKRKTNRTGFPTQKKKKKLVTVQVSLPALENALAPVATSSSGDKSEKTLTMNEIIVISDDEVEEVENFSERIPWTSNSTAFSATLTERVKMRRRNSLDSISSEEREEIIAGIIEVPGVVPSFMDVPNPPIIMPHKSNYLQAGILSSYYKQAESERGLIDPKLTVTELETMYGKRLIKEVICPTETETGFKNEPIVVDEPYALPFDVWSMGVIRTRIAYEDWCQLEEKRRAEEREKKGKLTDGNQKGTKGQSVSGVKRKRVALPEHPPDSWTFKKLRINTYSNRPTSTQENDDQRCDCKEGDFKCASDDCLNRVVFTECPTSCGDTCMNRRIQKHEWAPDLHRFMTEKKGYGVKSSVGIKRGDFILEYVGEVVSATEFKDRMTNLYANDTHHYCLQLDSGLVIDGHRSGGEGRFVNHSCEPNCHMQKWSVNGLSRMALFALRDIPAEEELSYDYNFALYNETEGQPCYCGSVHCRGVIGGKSKSKQSPSRRKNSSRLKGLVEGSILFRGHLSPNTKVKVLLRKEVKLARGANVFLIRNYEKIRLMRGGANAEDDRVSDRVEKLLTGWVGRYRAGSRKNNPLVLTGEESKVARVARMAQIFFELYKQVTTTKDSSGRSLCEAFMELPLKRSSPVFYTIFDKNGLDGFKAIEKKILCGRYKTLQALQEDMRLVLTTFAQAFKTEKPETGPLVDRIKKVYKDAKQKAIQALEPFIVPPTIASSSSTENSSPERSSRARSQSPSLPPFLPPDPNDSSDRVRCICGTFSEEGTMIQCEMCFVWQHCDCVGAKTEQPTPIKASSRRGRGRSPKKLKLLDETELIETVVSSDDQVQFDLGAVGISDELAIVPEDFTEMVTQVICCEGTKDEMHYYCERCDPRELDVEVKLKCQDDEECKTHYLTLQREDGLLVRKNDTVYVLREWPMGQRLLPDGTPKPPKSYLTAGPLVKEECDIFRIDSLWKDAKGNRMAHGYNYLRPHETHHEPTRRFYPNEILKAPIHEVIHIDLIHGHCWVLDSATYCKGRPIDCIEEHLYICDLRVNKTANSFDKVGKRSQVVCTKSFAFNHFNTRIKINRNVHPHGPPSPDFKMRPSIQIGGSNSTGKWKGKGNENKCKKHGNLTEYDQSKIDKKRGSQRENLHSVINGIEVKIPNFRDDPVDLSGLLHQEKRNRKSKPYRITL